MNNIKSRFAILSKVALGLALASTLSLGLAKSSPVGTNESEFAKALSLGANDDGQVPAKITKDPTFGYSISLTLNQARTTRKPATITIQSFLREESSPQKISGSLLSINGIHTKHRNLSTVRQMLRGPIGSSVDIQILTDKGERNSFKCTREKPDQFPELVAREKSAWTDLQMENAYAGPGFGWMMNSAHTSNYENMNLDLVMRGLKRPAVHEAELLSEGQNVEAYLALTKAAVACDRVGDIATAKEYLDLAIAKAGQGLIWKQQQMMLEGKMPLEHLLAVGQFEECKKLCEIGLAFERSIPKAPYGDMQLQREIKLDGIYADCLTQMKDRNASKAVSEYFESLKKSNSPYAATCLIQAGALFSKVGQYDQAVDALKKSLLILERYDEKKPHLSLSKIPYTYQLNFKLAQYQFAAGQFDEADKTLNALKNFWHNRLSVEDNRYAEELAFFPAPSDIYLELARLNLSSSRTSEAIENASHSIERLSTAFGPNDFSIKEPLLVWAKALRKQGILTQAEKVEKRAGNLQEPPELKEYDSVDTARMIRNTLSLIDDGNEVEAKKVIARLHEIYKEEGKKPLYPEPQINLFCSLLSIARKLSDKKFYESSNQLIAKLLTDVDTQEGTPAVVPFLIIEKSINAERQEKDCRKKWTVIADRLENKTDQSPTQDSGSAGQCLSRQSNLRTIAELYLGAGEIARASLLLAQSTRFQIERGSAEHIPGDRGVMEDTLLELDYALLAAEQGSFDKAERLAKATFTKCPSKFLTVVAPKTYEFYGGEINPKFVLNFEFKIEKLVKLLILKNELEISEEILTDLFQKSKLAFDKNETSEVLRLAGANRDWNKSPDVTDGTLNALMARVLYLRGKSKDALESVNFNIANERIPTFSFYILAGDIAKANDLPGRAAHFYSEAEKSGPQVTFAMDENNYANRKDLLRKAATLSASDPNFDKIEKANIFLRYGLALEPHDKLQSIKYLQQAYELVPDIEQRKADLLHRISGLRSEITTAKSLPTDQNVNSKSIINDLCIEAKLAERSGRKDAYNHWIRLADEESRIGQSLDAMNHAEHAILMLPRNFDPTEYTVPIPYYSTLIESLVKNGQYTNAEKILVDIVNKTQSLDGRDSFSAAQQGVQLVLFYVKHQADDDAIRTLNQLTLDCPRTFETGWPETANSQLLRAQRELLEQSRGDLSLRIYRQLLEVNCQTFEADDERVADSLVQLAAVEKAIGKNGDYEERLREASQIYKLYFADPTSHARYQFHTMLMALGIKHDVDIRSERQNSIFFQGLLSPTSEQITELQNHYNHVRVSTPYGGEAQRDLSSLMYLSTESKNWSVLASAATARIEMSEREPDRLAGRQIGCVKTQECRLRFYERAIEANLHLGKKQEAAELVARAEAHFMAPSFHELCTLSKLAFDCGDLTESEKLAAKAENLMDGETWEFQDLVKLWRALGRESQAVSVEVKAKSIENEYDARMQTLKKGAFNSLNL